MVSLASRKMVLLNSIIPKGFFTKRGFIFPDSGGKGHTMYEQRIQFKLKYSNILVKVAVCVVNNQHLKRLAFYYDVLYEKS